MKKSLNPSSLGLLDIASMLTRRNMPAQQEVEPLMADEFMTPLADPNERPLDESAIDVSMNRVPQGMAATSRPIMERWNDAQAVDIDLGDFAGEDGVVGGARNSELNKYRTKLYQGVEANLAREFGPEIAKDPAVWGELLDRLKERKSIPGKLPWPSVMPEPEDALKRMKGQKPTKVDPLLEKWVETASTGSPWLSLKA